MTIDDVMQPGLGDEADCFAGRDTEYGTTELKIPAVVQPTIDQYAARSVPMTIGEPIEAVDSVPREWQMPQVTSRPGSSHIRLGCQTQQTHKWIASLPPNAAPNASMNRKSMPLNPVSFYPCI